MGKKQSVRIGGAAAFLGDSSISMPQLIRGGNVDYIVFDYLAEVTMSFLGRAKAKRPQTGYAAFFVDVVLKQYIKEVAEKGIKLVTNAGGVNSQACRDAILELCKENDVQLKVAIVEGDNLMPRFSELRQRGYTEMFTGGPWPNEMLSMNAYLGAKPIAEALRNGADIVITGRVVDSALTLGPLMYEFDWKETDYDLLAAGSLAGHINECGAQATGGLHTDWESVPDWENIGYPVLECYPDGRFVVNKPEGTGGLITAATVAEQMLYEIGDPQAYMLPDVVCDFSQVKIKEIAKNQVEVSDTIGYPPTGYYKVCGTYQDGWRCMSLLPVVGVDAVRKAERQSAAVLSRMNKLFDERNWGPYRDALVECLGSEAVYGQHARARNTREVVCKIGIEHDLREPLEFYASEAFSPTTSMSPGTTSWFSGKATVSPIIKIFSFLIPKSDVPFKASVGSFAETYTQNPETVFDPSAIVRPNVTDSAPTGATATVPLIKLAWGRSGDKGNTFNAGFIPRKPAYLPFIRNALTEEAAFDFMKHVFAGAVKPKVERFDLPGTNSLNYLFYESLGGGQMATLRLDALAKGMAQQLLEFPIPVPQDWEKR